MELTKEQRILFYNRMFVEQLESLAKNVIEGEKSPKQIASTITQITESLRELNEL